jgi:hypothetical protein
VPGVDEAQVKARIFIDGKAFAIESGDVCAGWIVRKILYRDPRTTTLYLRDADGQRQPLEAHKVIDIRGHERFFTTPE